MNQENKDPHRYDDIIGMERPISKKHPPMKLSDRAAQFAPFAALTGHGEAVEETAGKNLDHYEDINTNETFKEDP